MEKKIAVVLSGCDVFDGSEVNEVVLTLLALEAAGLRYQCYAPDKEQLHTISYITSDENTQTKNILVESTRIVYGNLASLSSLNPENYSGLIVPGGFGVVKNLSTFALKGIDFTIDETFRDVMINFAGSKKPIGFMCIAPILLPKIYNGVRCTIGNDREIARVINKLGGIHIDCNVNRVVVDRDYKVISTPAYMLASSISEAKSGIDKLVQQVSTMI